MLKNCVKGLYKGTLLGLALLALLNIASLIEATHNPSFNLKNYGGLLAWEISIIKLSLNATMYGSMLFMAIQNRRIIIEIFNLTYEQFRNVLGEMHSSTIQSRIKLPQLITENKSVMNQSSATILPSSVKVYNEGQDLLFIHEAQDHNNSNYQSKIH